MSGFPRIRSRIDRRSETFETNEAQFLKQMGAAYQEWGFAGITNHGIDVSVIKNALKATLT